MGCCYCGGFHELLELLFIAGSKTMLIEKIFHRLIK